MSAASCELCRPDGAVPDREQALRGAAVAGAAGFPDLAMRALPELSGALVAAAEAVRRPRHLGRLGAASCPGSRDGAEGPVVRRTGLGSLQRRVAP